MKPKQIDQIEKLSQSFLEKESIDAYTKFLDDTHQLSIVHSNILMDEFLQLNNQEIRRYSMPKRLK